MEQSEVKFLFLGKDCIAGCSTSFDQEKWCGCGQNQAHKEGTLYDMTIRRASGYILHTWPPWKPAIGPSTRRSISLIQAAVLCARSHGSMVGLVIADRWLISPTFKRQSFRNDTAMHSNGSSMHCDILGGLMPKVHDHGCTLEDDLWTIVDQSGESDVLKYF